MQLKYIKCTLIPVAVATLILSGCASSPVVDKPSPTQIGDIMRPTMTTGAGYALGDALTEDDTGGPIGALAGLVTGLVWNEVSEKNQNSAYAEGYAQGARDAETQVLNDMWTNQTENGPPGESANYPNGRYEGVDRTPYGSMEFPTHTNIIR